MASREHGSSTSQALIQALADVGAIQDPQTAEDYLQLIQTTAEVEAEARTLLQDAISSARSAGVTWSAIGTTLGMSKQAAQKRFATHGLPPGDARDPNERILGPVTAFDELRELALAGQYGWHSVEFGPYYHRVVRSPTQWEHARVTMFRRRASVLQEQGWQVIGSEFPFTYLKRDLGTPALVEPVP